MFGHQLHHACEMMTVEGIIEIKDNADR